MRFRTAPRAPRTSGLLLSAHLDSEGIAPEPRLSFERAQPAFLFESSEAVDLDDIPPRPRASGPPTRGRAAALGDADGRRDRRDAASTRPDVGGDPRSLVSGRGGPA